MQPKEIKNVDGDETAINDNKPIKLDYNVDVDLDFIITRHGKIELQLMNELKKSMRIKLHNMVWKVIKVKKDKFIVISNKTHKRLKLKFN